MRTVRPAFGSNARPGGRARLRTGHGDNHRLFCVLPIGDAGARPRAQRHQSAALRGKDARTVCAIQKYVLYV